MNQPTPFCVESLEGRQMLAAWAPQAKLIGLDQVANNMPGINGSGMSIAIIDSGVDYNHPVLSGKVIGGWDFAANDSNAFPDSNGHGTGVAGMAAARGFDYNGYHYQGIAPGANIIALRQGGSKGVAAALQWVIANKSKYNIQAVNVTDYAGGGDSNTWKSIAASYNTLGGMGVYITQPSGNAGTRTQVGTHDSDYLVVGSTNKGGGMSGFTVRGPGLDFLAPGEKIGLPYYDPGSKKHIYVDVGDGTSWSAPQIAAAALLVRQVKGGASNAEVTDILKDTASWKYDSATNRSYPLLNLFAALQEAYRRAGKTPPAGNPNPTPTPPPTTPQQPGGVVVTNPTRITANTTIQAENFDAGTDAFRDIDAGSTGNSRYRAGVNVDFVTTTDGGTGQAIGMTKAGEWLKYSVDVEQTGTYTLEFRVSALGAGGQFYLDVDGKNVSGTMTVPDTKNWNTYTTINKSGVAISAGKHAVKLVFTKNGSTGYVANFNYLTFKRTSGATTPTTPTPTPSVFNISATAASTLQAEDFDAGTRGGTWHDTDTTNTGGNNYRPGIGVDIITVNDSGSTRAVGVVKAGEWLKYSVNVAAMKNYNIEFRTAALGAGGQFYLEVDGKNVTGALNVPDTKSWTAYTNVIKTNVNLTAGKHTLRLVFSRNNTKGYAGNFNAIKFVPVTTAAPAPGPTTSPFKTFNVAAGTVTTIQAEDFDNNGFRDLTSANEGKQYRNTAVDIEKTTDTGGGHNVGYTKGGEWLAYTLNVTKAGTFNVDTRIASAYSGGTFHIEVDGKNVSGTMQFTNTGNFQKWATVRKAGVQLSAGRHVVKIVVDSTGGKTFAGNINWIKIG